MQYYGMTFCGTVIHAVNELQWRQAVNQHLQFCITCQDKLQVRKKYRMHGIQTDYYFCLKCNDWHELSKIGMKHLPFARVDID